jgi:hypothetical protein
LFLTILNYFRQILVAFKYVVQSDWLIIVKNLELPYNVKLKTQVVTDRILSRYNTSAQNLSKINAMINPLVVESLTVITIHEEGIYYLYNFVPNNFIECDLDLKIA